MQTYPTPKIRNVALVGHQGSGKTSLVEALLHVSGATKRLGSVGDGSTVSDFDPEEQRRGISVSLALVPVEHEGHKLNFLDTPGYPDFVGDVDAALRVADLALFVVSAVDGVEVQTEITWRAAADLGVPRAVFVNKLDRERASYARTLDQLRDRFGAGIAPLQWPVGEESELRGVVNLLADQAWLYDGGPRASAAPVPDELAEQEHAFHEQLVEGIVVADDDLMERYLADEPIAVEELKQALAAGIADATVFPVVCGSATQLVGIDRLATFLVDEAPPPTPADGPTAVQVFKTLVDPYVGRVNLFRVVQGELVPDQHLVNERTGHDERLHGIVALRGKEQLGVERVAGGDLGAVPKLDDTRTGDVLVADGVPHEVPALPSREPLLAFAIRPRNKGEEDKLANALHRLLDEDPALRLQRDPDTHQTLLRGMGEAHLGIALERLARKFGVEVDTEPVLVAYRETITSAAEGEGRHKKQTGGAGQFGVASLRVEPLPRGSGFEFVDAVVGGAIPRQFLPAVEKGVVEAMAHGGVHGHPVVDVRVTCFDGKHHPVDSKEVAFKMAGSLAFRAALEQAGPLVLEPVSRLVVVVPEEHQGDVMGDLNSKRGRILGTAALSLGEVEVEAEVPTSEILRYAIDLRSLAHGRGRFSVEHAGYEPVPPNLVARMGSHARAAATA